MVPTNKKVLALLAAGLAAIALSTALRPSRSAGPAALSPAPDFRLADLNGQVVTLSSYRGKAVLLNFWASWCDACKKEMPDLDKLQTALKGKDFTVLALSVDEGGRKPVMGFVARYNPTFPVLLSDRKTAEAYGIFGLPASFLIDKNGSIRSRYVGPIYEPAVENDILTLALQGEKR